MEKLCKAGFTVWTPTAIEVKRIGRKRERVERDVAVLPGILFADSSELNQLVTVSKAPGLAYRKWDREARRMVTHRPPPFAVFRYMDDYPLVRDRDLDPLRLVERRAVKKEAVREFAKGEAVRYPGAGFEGLTGVVECVNGRYVAVLFPGFSIPVKIAGRLLLEAA